MTKDTMWRGVQSRQGKLLAAVAVAALTWATGSSAQSPDPWRLSRVTDKLSGASTLDAIAEVRADDGHHFELAATCDADTPGGLTIEVWLLDRSQSFQITQSATGFGYAVQMHRSASTRTRIDQGQIAEVTSEVGYTNEVVLKFPNFGALAQGNAQLPNGLGNMATLLELRKASGSAEALASGSTLKIQTTLADGSDPLIAVRISDTLRRFVGSCQEQQQSPPSGN